MGQAPDGNGRGAGAPAERGRARAARHSRNQRVKQGAAAFHRVGLAADAPQSRPTRHGRHRSAQYVA